MTRSTGLELANKKCITDATTRSTGSMTYALGPRLNDTPWSDDRDDHSVFAMTTRNSGCSDAARANVSAMTRSSHRDLAKPELGISEY